MNGGRGGCLELASSDGGGEVLVDTGGSREEKKERVRKERGKRGEEGGKMKETYRSPTFSAIPQEDW